MFGWGPQKDSPTRAKEISVEKGDKKDKKVDDGAWGTTDPAAEQKKEKSAADNLRDTAQRRQ